MGLQEVFEKKDRRSCKITSCGQQNHLTLKVGGKDMRIEQLVETTAHALPLGNGKFCGAIMFKGDIKETTEMAYDEEEHAEAAAEFLILCNLAYWDPQ